MSFCVPKLVGSVRKSSSAALFLALLSFFALPLSRSEATSFTTGLVGHWNMDETSGTDVLDSSGNSNNGTRNGATQSTDYAPTIFGNTRALSFDGNDTVSVGAVTGMPTNGFTVCSWLNNTETSDITTSNVGIGIGDGTGGRTLWMGVWNDNDQYMVSMGDGTTDLGLGVDKNTGWHHLCAVKTAAGLSGYIDGVFVGTDSDATSGLVTTELTIGNYATGSFYFKGGIDDVRIYDRALSAEEISVLAARKSLVGYWKFDETSGTNAADSSGMGNDGTLTNGPTISTDVSPTNFPNARSLSFDGTDDYVNIPDKDIYSPSGSYSVSFWVNVDSYDDTYTSWVSKWGEVGNQREFAIGESTGGFITFYHSIDGANSLASISVARPSTGAWHHLVGVFTSGSELEFFLDGASVGSADPSSTAVVNGTAPLRIGGSTEFGGAAGYFDGKIDDVRIYDRALSADEIADLAAGNHPEATWTGEHSIYYEDPHNWDTGVVPDPYSNVTIANAGARPILTDAVSLSDLTINSNASLDLKDNDLTMLDGGTFSNNGTLILDGNQTLTDFTHDSNSGQAIIRGTSAISRFATGLTYNDLRIEDPTEDGLVGYWKLDEGSGSTTLDLSGNGNDGTLVGGPTFNTDIPSTNFFNQRSLRLNDADESVDLVDGVVSTAGSAGGWVKAPNGWPTWRRFHIWKSRNWTVGIGEGNIAASLWDGGANTTKSITSSSIPSGWFHVMSTWENDGALKLYVNGIEVGSTSFVLAETQSGFDADILYYNDPEPSQVDWTGPYYGDDVRLYNRALSANEVMNLARGSYAAGSAGTATHSTPSLDDIVTVNGTLSLDSGNFESTAHISVFDALSLLRGGGNLTLGSSGEFQGGITLSGGTLTGGSGDMQVLGNLSIFEGSLIAPSGNMSLYQNFSKTGGTFSHNDGTVTIVGNPTPSFRSGGAVFATVNVNMPGIFVALQDAFQADALNVLLGGFRPNGNAVTVNDLNIAGGNFEGDDATLDVNRSLTLSNGTLTAPSGLLSLSGSFIRSGGTFAHNDGRVLLNGSGAFTLTNTNAFNDLYLNDGLVGYWNLDETSGTSATDLSGYGNTGTHTNGPTISTNTPDLNFTNARSIELDGNDDYVTASPVSIGSAFTIAVWVYKTSDNTPQIVSQENGSYFTFYMRARGSSGFTSAGVFKEVTGPNVPLNEWAHLTMTYDGSNLRYYLNGVQEASAAASGNPDSSVGGELRFGCQPLGCGDRLTGNIDDVRIYNRALSADEIARLAAGNQPATSNSTTTLGAALDVNGDLFLNAGTLDASSSDYGITLAGDWKNNGGVFTEREGTVALDGTSQSIPSSETFYNLTKTVSSADTLTFGAGSTTTITATVTLTGASSNLLSLRCSTDGQQWKIDPQGTRTLAHLDVKDSNNVNADPILAFGLNITDSGNLTNWDFDDHTPSSSSSSSDSSSFSSSTSTSSSNSSFSEEASSEARTGGGGGGRGTAGPGGRSTKAEAARQALVDRFKSQVASDETTVPPIGASSRSSRPTVVTGSASSSPAQTAAGSASSAARIVTQDRGRLKVQEGSVAVLYKDVPVDAWFAPYVSLLIEEKIADGYKDENGKPKGEFGVTNPVTYAEVAKMVLEAADKDLKKTGTPRNLTAKGTWASPYIALAESLQMSVYTPSLDVMKPATRGEVIQSILEAFGIPVKAKNIATFTDLPENHPHAQAIGVAYLYGLIDGDANPDGTPKGTVRPDDRVNRAEVAKIIALALKLLK